MAKVYRPVDRDQPFLLPPGMREWPGDLHRGRPGPRDHRPVPAAVRQTAAGLFAEDLALCARLGMGEVGTIALDGTKIGASASKDANRAEEARGGPLICPELSGQRICG